MKKGFMYSKAADVWSFGKFVCEIASGPLIFT